MSYILNIDTATEAAHVSLAQNGVVLQQLVNQTQKEHASFVQPAIEQLIKTAGISFTDIAAIAIAAGPGSYTGLRIGMASAKGLCFALNKPLIAINTLAVMAKAAVLQQQDKTILYCPMIDARRMEVFTALYNDKLEEIIPPNAVILNENSFNLQLQNNKILFFGSGADKWKTLVHNNSAALFTQVSLVPQALAALSCQHFLSNQFSNLAYTEPFYIKGFMDNN